MCRLDCRACLYNDSIMPDVLKPDHTVAEKCDNLSQKSATVAEFRRCLAVFGDSLTFLRHRGQGFNVLTPVSITAARCVA